MARQEKYPECKLMSWDNARRGRKPLIHKADEVRGCETELHIACTQLNVSRKEQAKTLAEWITLIPQLQSLEALWFHSRLSQELLDVATTPPRIRSLFIKWSGRSITGYSSIPQNAPQLQRLYLGSNSTSIDLAPLGRLKKLQWLEVNSHKNAEDYGFIKRLLSLDRLSISGGHNGRQKISSPDIFPSRSHLQFLIFANAEFRDKNLAPIASLARLRYLAPISHEHPVKPPPEVA